MKEDKNEELQSRRSFFKNAAKGALPIIGAIALAHMPAIANAGEVISGCGGNCSTNCTGECIGNCAGTCKANCQNSCNGGCIGTCKAFCQNSSN